jgi:hypothetical protein
MRRRVVTIGAGLVAAGAVAAGGAAWTTAADDQDESARGPAAERARAAALAHVGGGRALAVERKAEGAEAWEVEVARAGGATVEVLLDDAYRVLRIDAESEDADGPDEDRAED